MRIRDMSHLIRRWKNFWRQSGRETVTADEDLHADENREIGVCGREYDNVPRIGGLSMMKPTEADKELELAAQLTPGPWVQHSRSVAENARIIAEKTKIMDCDKAYVMGLMHDIGRRDGIKGILHIFDGYDYMMSTGEEEIAQICLTHSFPIRDADTFIGKYDCSSAQKLFLQQFLKQREYSHYDILIQLCDAISLPNGACIMEKRLVDVALRHGLPDFTIDKWKAFMNTKKHFDNLCGCNIYTLLSGILENSFTDLI